MHVLILQNATAEGPGTIGDHLYDAGVATTVVDLERGQPVPGLGAFSHLVIMGGPMAVYEMDRVSYLGEEEELIGRAVDAGVPVLGICLGSQLLAHVLGARVYAGGAQEVGWSDVTLTDDGVSDRCIGELAVAGGRHAQVFQWHGDTFDLPSGSTLLASSGIYPHQAFRYNDTVYGLQFHIEVTPEIVHGWLKNEKSVDLPLIDRRSHDIYGQYRRRAGGFYRAFFGR